MSDLADGLDDDDDDDEYDNFNERFVEFIRLWGLAEYLLDAAIGVIFRSHSGAAIGPPPVTLMRKVSFMKQARIDIPAVAAVAPIIDFITTGFSVEKDLRNTLVHGFPIKIEDNHTAHFVWARPTKAGLKYQLRTVRPKDWQRLSDLSMDLWVRLVMLIIHLDPAAAPPLNQSKEAAREYSMEIAANFPGSKRLRDLLQEIVASRG